MTDIHTGAEAFRVLQDRLFGQEPADGFDGFGEPPFRRLYNALGTSSGDSPGAQDLVGLIRHALRYWGTSTGTDPRLEVPRPLLAGLSAEFRRRSAMEFTAMGSNYYCRSLPWTPEWLPSASTKGLDSHVAAGEPRRGDHSVWADPFFSAALDYRDYRSPAQRAAIRAVVDAPPGSTLAVVLPTGEGKSACFYTAAKVGWPDRASARGTVVVITPTVALALDHEANARAFGFKAPQLAYRAGDPRSQDLVESLKDGTLGICFASPEAALGPLLSALRSAARDGLLGALVVDEAHLVDAWGGVFRPDFQFLAGLQRELLDASPAPKPRTILLTATLTETAAAILRALFVEQGSSLPIVAAPTIRPEHEYWTPGLVSEDEQERYVDEAVACLPRPLIVYATSRQDVDRHFTRLRNAGYRRIGWMTGDSTTEERSRLLRRWGQGSCDIVVATSAFGLGVNNADVRAVVHACVPEGVDRFYQEVGRSGRDGCAALSLLVPTHRNTAEGRRLARQKLITAPIGAARWKQMFLTGTHSKSPTGDDVLELEFDVAPGADPDRIDMRNEQSTLWNLRVVAMMAIANLVSLRSAPRWDRSGDGLKAVLGVTIEDTRHLDPAWFASRVEPHRKRVKAASDMSMSLMEGYLNGSQCIGEAVSRQYAIQPGIIGDEGVVVRGVCPGCASCRTHASASHGVAHPRHPWQASVLAPGLQRLLGPDGSLVVTYRGSFVPGDRPGRQRRMAALRRLIEGSFRAARIEPATGLTGDWLQELAEGWPMFVALDPEFGGDLPPGPTLVFRSGAVPLTDFYDRPAAGPLIVFGSEPDPRFAGRVMPVSLVERYLLQ